SISCLPDSLFLFAVSCRFRGGQRIHSIEVAHGSPHRDASWRPKDGRWCASSNTEPLSYRDVVARHNATLGFLTLPMKKGPDTVWHQSLTLSFPVCLPYGRDTTNRLPYLAPAPTSL